MKDRQYCQLCRDSTWHIDGDCQLCVEDRDFDNMSVSQPINSLQDRIESVRIEAFAREVEHYLTLSKEYRKAIREKRDNYREAGEEVRYIERRLRAHIRKILE